MKHLRATRRAQARHPGALACGTATAWFTGFTIAALLNPAYAQRQPVLKQIDLPHLAAASGQRQ